MVHPVKAYLAVRENKESLLTSLLDGSDKPQAVRRVQIPKPAGGMRQPGIPTVVDRLIQQAMAQVLEPILDPMFSESSYGFRPGRGAHDALRKAAEYVEDGRSYVVDIDLEKFFDRVNHEVLMSRLVRHVKDKIHAIMWDDSLAVQRSFPRVQLWLSARLWCALTKPRSLNGGNHK